MELQRGRARESAEGHNLKCGTCRRRQRFNGAALVRARKGGFGAPAPARRRSFNGAALVRARKGASCGCRNALAEELQRGRARESAEGAARSCSATTGTARIRCEHRCPSGVVSCGRGVTMVSRLWQAETCDVRARGGFSASPKRSREYQVVKERFSKRSKVHPSSSKACPER